jgi:hypothetical protein
LSIWLINQQGSEVKEIVELAINISKTRLIESIDCGNSWVAHAYSEPI